MRQNPFIWLGSGRSRKHKVAYKGKMLDLAARAGLPVPQGGILLDELFRIFLAEGVVELIDDRVIVPDAIWLYEVIYRDVRFPKLNTHVAVRSAAAVSKDQAQEESHARLNIDFDDPQEMATALRSLWSALGPENEHNKMDMLVMSMVESETWGRATTRRKEDQDFTTYNQNSDEGSAGKMNLSRPRLFRRSGEDLPPFAKRLQKLLGGVRRTFGRGDYEIEWADDGEICWLIQVL